MKQDYPVPPPKLIREWCEQLFGCPDEPEINAFELARLASEYGADQELQACCEWITKDHYSQLHFSWRLAEQLREARRPKPPSLKEQALMGLNRIEQTNDFFSDGMKDLATIRRALEAMPDD